MAAPPSRATTTTTPGMKRSSGWGSGSFFSLLLNNFTNSYIQVVLRYWTYLTSTHRHLETSNHHQNGGGSGRGTRAGGSINSKRRGRGKWSKWHWMNDSWGLPNEDRRWAAGKCNYKKNTRERMFFIPKELGNSTSNKCFLYLNTLEFHWKLQFPTEKKSPLAIGNYHSKKQPFFFFWGRKSLIFRHK
jgi:hypothetical protein